jgi:hypothetical protein
MMVMKVPIGHRRGSGANGTLGSVSRATFWGSVAYAAEPFFDGPSPRVSTATLT